MKKIYMALTIVIFLCSISCSKENYGIFDKIENTENTEPQIEVPLTRYTICVNQEGRQEDSKVAVSAAGEVSWEAGDRLYVFNSAWSSLYPNGVEATLVDGVGESSATFEFEAPVERNEGFYVLYGAEGSLEGGTLQVIVPDTVEGSAKPVLACHMQDLSGSFALKCVTTYVRITLPESMSSVDIFPVHNSEEKLCGTVVIDSNNGYSFIGGAYPKVTINNPASVCYVNLLPGTLSKGYIVCFSGASEKMFKSVSYGAPIALEPKSMVNLAPATYTPISATVTPVTNHSKYKAGDVSGANNLSYRLKTHSCSVSPVANVNDNLKKHFTVEKYYYDTTSESAIGEFTFSDVGSYTIQASFKFECEGVSYEQLKIAQGTADITGLPYNSAPTSGAWSIVQGKEKISFSGSGVELGSAGTTTADPTIKSPEFYLPTDINTLTSVTGTVTTNKAVVYYTCQLKGYSGGAEFLNQTSPSKSTTATAIDCNNVATVLTTSSPYLTFSVNSRTRLAGNAKITNVKITYR